MAPWGTLPQNEPSVTNGFQRRGEPETGRKKGGRPSGLFVLAKVFVESKK